MDKKQETPETPASFSGAEVGQELERQAEVARLATDLLRDFYQTFRLAQQETAIQPPIFSLLADQHQQTGHQNIMADALRAADDKVDELMPPRGHGDTDAASRNHPENGFRAIWTEYAKTLQDPDSGIRRPLTLILDDMLVQDIYYQENERPNRGNQDEVHQSFVREYVLGDRLTGSAQLLAVRDQLRAALVSPPTDSNGDWMLERLEELIKKWESNYPGRSFMPQG
jgi:hypothetical protein